MMADVCHWRQKQISHDVFGSEAEIEFGDLDPCHRTLASTAPAKLAYPPAQPLDIYAART
jgi:hypothetical protein